MRGQLLCAKNAAVHFNQVQLDTHPHTGWTHTHTHASMGFGHGGECLNDK